MNKFNIRSMLVSSSSFERLISEMWVNNDLIGHISQEIENGPIEIVLYKEGINNLPQEIIERTIAVAKGHLLGDEDTGTKVLRKTID